MRNESTIAQIIQPASAIAETIERSTMKRDRRSLWKGGIAEEGM
ncbi:hypothetical protein [Myxacorys almedinensis]|nr:hypothetical protein [Myxacorys almedinensis]